MMSLVSYDNSDSSDSENDSTNSSLSVIPENPIREVTAGSSEQINDESNIFNLLPRPTGKKAVVAEEDDEFLHKKETVYDLPRPRAKISVPSLNDFKDVDGMTTNAKPRTANGKKSGLLSILPQPKNAVKSTTRSLIPQVLTSKPNSTVMNTKSPSITSVTNKSKTETKGLVTSYSDESEDEDVQTDFFSINKPIEPLEDFPVEETAAPTAEPIETTSKQPRSLESYFKKTENVEITDNVIIEEYSNSEVTEQGQVASYMMPESSNGEAVLDEEAIMKLCGTRGKRKKEEIQIVDVNQEQVLADAREWLLKGLMDDTTKRVSSSKRKGKEITSQQKRKHQITYLAHQAKANEAELQNQWANSRMSKRQTQSKYGF